MNPSPKNLSTYFRNETKLSNLIFPTDIPRLSLIQGFWDTWGPSEMSLEQVRKLISECRELPFDYVLFDLGAGPAASHLEFFHQADEKIMVTNSEPTSVEKNYRLMEAFICYSLKETSTQDAYSNLQKALQEYRTSHKKGYFSFRQHLKNAVGFDFDFFETIQQKPVRLIVNESRSRLDQDLGSSIKSVCRKYFDLPIDDVGCIDFDNAVWQSVKSREPVLIEKPFTPLAGQFLSICKHLASPNLNANYYRAVV